ncbi:hypothetical protein C1Y40_03311 [Mycobacterium talmoniae]|uniref:Uncharacterized protein n=1 Tax=Mycobacterium talmoniae TaxID=1858794 RepID=A0A2S8BIK7_9MYCO|nr:hypothetical protein C1Y40_03311 [Mycobacterium talmoniae]
MGSNQDPPAGDDRPDEATTPAGAEPPAYAEQPPQYPSGGSMRFQDADSTQPRPPTVAEADSHPGGAVGRRTAAKFYSHVNRRCGENAVIYLYLRLGQRPGRRTVCPAVTAGVAARR